MSRILMIVSAADALPLTDGTSHPTGYWAEEVVASHQILRAAGAEVDIATPGGATPTVDAGSVNENNVPRAAEFRKYLAEDLGPQLEKPLSLDDVQVSDYDALYIPGGHGPMADLAADPRLGEVLAEADDSGRVIAVLCHGPAALLSAIRPDGSFVFAGRRLTAFTDDEERQGGLADRVPYLVETRLRELGAVVEPGPAWTGKVIVDGNLISGQNPQSSTGTAEQVVRALA